MPISRSQSKYAHLRPRKKGPVRFTPEEPKLSYSYEEAEKWLRLSRKDYWQRTQMRISYNALAALIGVHYHEVKRVHLRRIPGKFLYDRLDKVIDKIERREICFTDKRVNFIMPGKAGNEEGAKWKRKKISTAAEMGGAYVVWTPPPGPPKKIGAIAKKSEWDLWACCARCSHSANKFRYANRFLPALINGEEHVICYHCYPPDQYPSIGAIEIKTSLIYEALINLKGGGIVPYAEPSSL